MRCLTLAKALHKKNVNVEFISRPHSGNLIALIEQQGFTVQQLPELAKISATVKLQGYTSWLGCTEKEDADDTKSLLLKSCTPAEVLIVDHYGLGSLYTQTLEPYFQHRMVIDDLANRHHECETLLDQNLLPHFQYRYQEKVNAKCICLLGPDYALLREEFYRQQPESTRQHLLIFFGGSDPWHLTLKAVQALQQLQLNTKRCPPVDVVIGNNHPDKQMIAEAISSLPGSELHIQSQQMARLMSRAKVMLGAGGSTHWERCIMGLPGLIVTVAENQRPTTEYLAELGACIWLGEASQITLEQLLQALNNVLTNPGLLKQISYNAQKQVPITGGSQAVVKHLMNQLEKRNR